MNKYYIIGFLIIIIILSYIYNKNKETFDINQKTVYIVWNDINNTQGLGDRIRGSIAIYQYCRESNINCIFDATFTEFNNFFKNARSNEPELKIDTEIVKLLDIYDDNDDNKIRQVIKNFIDNELKDKDKAYVFCNLHPKIPFHYKDIEFLKYITEPVDDLKNKINMIKSLIPQNYTIQHFRFIDKIEPDINKCEECYKLLNNRYKYTDILMSNSKVFKDYVKERKEIIMINCENCDELHIGLNPVSNIIEFTLLEYYILCGSKYIITYNQYDWISAFVYWTSKYYKIPIENYNI